MLGIIKSIVTVNLFQFLNRFWTRKEQPFVVNNILVVNAQGVGDMVIFTPVIEAIGRKYPTTKITVLTSQYGSEVLKNNPLITKIIVTENIHKMSLAKYFSLFQKLRKQSYDCIIETSFTCLSFKQMFLPLTIGAKLRMGYNRAGFCHLFPTHEIPWRKEHMIVMYGRIAELLGAPVLLKPKLYISSEDKIWANKFSKKLKKPIIVVHPSCQGEEKRWPIENLVEIIIWLAKRYEGSILITGVTKEKDGIEMLKEKIERQERNISLQIILDLPLLRLAALLEQVDLLLSVDTGIVHIATAAETPTLCLYGPTGQILWKPYNKNQIVLQKHPCAEIGNNQDTSQIIIRLEKCPAHGTACIKAISVDDVKQAIRENFLK